MYEPSLKLITVVLKQLARDYGIRGLSRGTEIYERLSEIVKLYSECPLMDSEPSAQEK